MFKDCWYNHLGRNRLALSQLNEVQLQQSIQRMELWLSDTASLVEDDTASLRYRNKRRYPPG